MFFKMQEKMSKEIEIPQDIKVEIKGNRIEIIKDGNKIQRKFDKVLIEKKENKIFISAKRATKREKKQINTTFAHIKNMLKGVEKEFTYKLEICSVHFPMNVSTKDKEVVIKNFLGETKERKAKILDGVEIKIDKNIIEVSSANKEAAGQTSANIERTTVVRGRDKRVFMDGIYIISKPEKELK